MSPEYDFEPQRGLPGPLPAGEHILWQGGPDWQRLATRTLHGRWIAIYFAVLMAWRMGSALATGAALTVALQGAAWALLLGASVGAMIALFAWASAKMAVYTITNRRVVIRYGVAYQVALNLPFTRVDGAGVTLDSDGSGDISLALNPEDHVAYLSLWPHVRAPGFGRPEPTLRTVQDARRVAEILAAALAASVDDPSASVHASAGPSPVAVRLPATSAVGFAA